MVAQREAPRSISRNTPPSFRIAIAEGPECPHCREGGFDDWWHDPRVRSGDGLIVSARGVLQCHGCGRFFSVTRYVDGGTHSTMRCATETGDHQ